MKPREYNRKIVKLCAEHVSRVLYGQVKELMKTTESVSFEAALRTAIEMYFEEYETYEQIENSH